MPKGTVPVTDALLDDMGEHHTEIELVFGEITALIEKTVEARKAAIILTAQLRSGDNEEQIGRLVEEWSRMSDALHRMTQAVHVGRVSVDQSRVAAHELRSTPAIRRVRAQVRRDNEERRTRERRTARQWDARTAVA